MALPSIYFLTPDKLDPTGGIRVIYRSAEILSLLGVPAAVVHNEPGFRPTWFEHSARILYPPMEIR
jgi:hypothetical protein